MTFRKKSLRSKVGRRIFLLFIASALIPILLLAVLYQFHGRRVLIDQAYARLHSVSAAHGESAYDRLVLADSALKSASTEIAQDAAVSLVETHFDTVFESLHVLRNSQWTQESEIQLFDQILTDDARLRLLEGKSTLVTQSDPGRQARIYLARALDSDSLSIGILVGEVLDRFLWTERDASPFQTELCVFDQQLVRLSCSGVFELGVLPAVLQNHRGESSGPLEWVNDGRLYLGNFREIFLDATFGIPGWIIVSGQPKKVALGTLGGFNDIFWPSLLASLLLTTLISLTQIRRTTVPLEKLIDATGRLAEKDFSTTIHIDSNDEFEQLSDSFNQVTHRLGRQFDVLSTLSSIDRAILFDLNIEQVVEEVLKSVRNIFNLPCAAIAVVDRDDPGQTNVYSLTEARPRSMHKQRKSTADAPSGLNSPVDGYWTDAHDMDHPNLIGYECRDVNQVFNLPISSKSGIGGLMMLGTEDRVEFTRDDLGYLHDFADRIGVALNSAARDEQLFRQARYDSLTGLPNRFLLVERLKQEVAQAQRNSQPFTVLYLDLDRFKKVNDSLGHAAGDALLQEAAHRLRNCVREGDTVARVGGDEFAIVLNEVGDGKIAATVAEHIVAAMDVPFVVFGTENFVTASIGIAVYPRDGASPSELLRNADMAMYRAKESGRSTFIFFEENMNAEVVRIATLDRELRRALSDKQLLLHYQPQIGLRTGDICGAEALVRWNHPKPGLLKPGTFIDCAEDSGLIVTLGQFVLTEACRQFVAWREQGIDVKHIAVNVSGRQFRQEWFAESVEQTIVRTGMPPHSLTLEITENVLIEDFDQVGSTLSRLKKSGIRVELDDFGTGYSSMSYLDALPIDTLKIDKAFISTIDAMGRGGVIAKLVLDMARSLGKAVVAEGVETPEQLQFLQKLNCDVGQGHLFSEALSPEAFSVFASKWNLVTRSQWFAALPDDETEKNT